MEFRYILEFVDLTETGKFSESAEQLYISQSSLSKHMKTLESDLGVPLFQRATKRKVQLTEYGQLFYPYAKQLARTWEDYTLAQEQHMQATRETLSIGSIPMLAQYQISDLVEQFQTEYPGIQLNLREAEAEKARELLRRHVLDFAFVRESTDLPPDEFTRIAYTSDHLVAVLPATHPLADQRTASLLQLAGERFLLLQHSSYMYELCIQECRKAGFEPNVVFSGAMAANILDLVRKCMGISLLTRRPVASLVTPDVVLVDIAPTITTDINLIYANDARPSVAASRFLAFFQAYCQDPEETE